MGTTFCPGGSICTRVAGPESPAACVPCPNCPAPSVRRDATGDVPHDQSATCGPGCEDDGDCAAGERCRSGVCVDCLDNRDCGGAAPYCDRATHTCRTSCDSHDDCDAPLLACSAGQCV